MRVGFVSDVVEVARTATTVARYPLPWFLSPRPHMDLADPGGTDTLYAGLTEVTAGQLQALRDEAQTRGIRFLAFPLTDRDDSTVLAGDRTLASTLCTELGIAAPEVGETRSTLLDRVSQRLCGKSLGRLFDRLDRKDRRG